MDETTRNRPDAPDESFEDEFTAATADLSPGGVAEAMEEMRDEANTPNTAPVYETSPISPAAGDATTYQSSATTPSTWESSGPSRTMFGIGGGTLAALLAAIGGAWAYTRWQRERNRPVNRLRRRASHLVSDIGKRLPEPSEIVERLPEGEVARPATGLGTLALVGLLLLVRALRQSDDEDEQESGSVVDQVMSSLNGHGDESLREEVRTRWGRISFPSRAALESAASSGASLVNTARERAPHVENAPRAGIGAGGVVSLLLVAYLVRRLLSGGDERQTWQGNAGGSPYPQQ